MRECLLRPEEVGQVCHGKCIGNVGEKEQVLVLIVYVFCILVMLCM